MFVVTNGARRRSSVTVVLCLMAALSAGCVEGPGFNPNARGITVLSPVPRTNLPDDVDVPVELSGRNWGPGRDVVLEECARVEGLDPRCEQVGALVTEADGTFPPTSVNVRYLLSVGGETVPCDTEVGDVTLPGLGTYYPRWCRLVVRYADEATGGGVAAGISFAGHVF